MWELRTLPAPAGLEGLGTDVELRELDCGALADLFAASATPAETTQRLLAASLHVDGEPLGFERLKTVPGRFYGALNRAIPLVLTLHELKTSASASAEPANDERAPASATGTESGEA